MNNTSDKNCWLYTFNMNNTQQNYAECLELILCLENIASNNFYGNDLMDINAEVYISRIDKTGINNVRTLLNNEKLLSSGETKKIKRLKSIETLSEGLQKTQGEHDFYYYIRINLDDKDNDITELRNLVLIMQSVLSIRNKIAVRFMYNSDIIWNEKDYFRISHYMRFMQQEYNCFYACYSENIDSLRLLSCDSKGIQRTFLPLIKVDRKLCQAFNKTWYLNYEYNDQNYEKLYTAIHLDEVNSKDIGCELFKIGLRMFFLSLPGAKYRTKKRKCELLEFLCTLVNEMQGVSPLDMILLGSMADKAFRKGNDINGAKSFLSKIQMLSLAIGQILENIVNHSECNCGVFTIRIQNKVQYLSANYPGYALDEEKCCVELLISDSNRSDSIVSHFLNSNKADISIKRNADEICLQHLFGEYNEDEMKNLWANARKNRPEMCHGLLSFVNGVRTLNGALRVRSSPSFENNNSKYIYYYNGNDSDNDNDREVKSFLVRKFVPGTQFSVIFNRFGPDENTNLIKDEWTFDVNNLIYSTTYKELAQALAFSEDVKTIDVSQLLSCLPYIFHDQTKKDFIVNTCKEWFDSILSEETSCSYMIYHCDVAPICNLASTYPEIIEPFCKGFLSSRLFINNKNNKYYVILLRNSNTMFSRIFASTAQVLNTHDVFFDDHVCVYFYRSSYSKEYLSYAATTLHDLLKKTVNDKVFPRIFPYTLFIKDDDGYTEFEKELMNQADTSITSNKKQGFKIEKTHMRLGNKVHLDTFYEMSLFFENPNYAYYTAFLFLKRFLSDNCKLLKQRKQLLIYGYASYSRAIVWSMIQILNEFNQLFDIENFPDIEFVIYQNDLRIESEQPQIQMYYSKEEWQRDPKTIWNPDDTKMIMIVPISSSLTTFEKMLVELCRASQKNFDNIEKYTAFWVRNVNKNENCSTKEEREFWHKVDKKNRVITLSNFNKVRYLTVATSTWRNPLLCEKCFPNDVIYEYPLVETDPTSTVPTQQFYIERDYTNVFNIDNTINDERVASLKNNILYGHVSQGSTNHYQYYIKTKVYFQQERKKVAQWLKDLREKDNNINSIALEPCINVLIIPQQANNVEFGQFVYEHYFQGRAECIIINTEKEFRSNLKAEYSGLFHRLHNIIKENPHNVRFHYIDISVHSGSSYNRAISLISSCIEKYMHEHSDESSEKFEFKIDKVFLLISRLSDDSKLTYVRNPSKNFHAYVELHISSMRNFGDSCVPCKLQLEAKRYYKKAATKAISSYWEKKTYDRSCVSFDQFDGSALNDSNYQTKGFYRMICSHRVTHFIHPIRGGDVEKYFFAIREFLEEIIYANTNEHYTNIIYRDVNDDNRKEWLSSALKVIARPFFSYEYKIRCVVMDLYLILAEYLIKECTVDDIAVRLNAHKGKDYLLKDNNLIWIYSFATIIKKIFVNSKWDLLKFIRHNILKGLTDIKSNYILRKDTIVSISNQLNVAYQSNQNLSELEEFYGHYLRSILRITHSSSDETKSVWLEYLLQYGKEYDGKVSLKSVNGINELILLVPNDIRLQFGDFLETLLIENNRPIYQAVIEFDKYKANCINGFDENNTHLFLNAQHMRNAKNYLSFQQDIMPLDLQLEALQALLAQLKQKDQNIECYKQLGERIHNIVKAKTKNSSEVILFGKYSEIKSKDMKYLDLPNYFVLFPEQFENENIREKSPKTKYFENQWNKLENDPIAHYILKKKGFYLLETADDAECFDIIIMLDNNYDDLVGKINVVHQKIEPVYVFIQCSLKRKQALEIIRMFLMFRYKLIQWLENDFNNNAIAVLAEQKNLAKLLSTDKIGDHAENDFVECQQKVLMLTTEEEFKEELDSHNWQYCVSEIGTKEKLYDIDEINDSGVLNDSLKNMREWFLLRAYVNSRISRLFRTMVRSGNDGNDNLSINYNDYYSRNNQSAMMRPVQNLQTIFFTPIKVGYIRKNYLHQIMKTVFFVVDETPDYKDDENATISERMLHFSNLIEDFDCISFHSDKYGQEYAYLSEYLAIILLDCFISGLKAGEVWNQASWGGLAFEKLSLACASQKCPIYLSREKGYSCGGVSFDYLVIKNKIFHTLRSEKKGPGMSQAAMRWYIDGLWRSSINDKNCPNVQAYKDVDEYIVKLPILKQI